MDSVYDCSYVGCDSSFKQKSQLDAHLATHSGAKEHKCPEADCVSSYASANALIKHRRAKHGYTTPTRSPKGSSFPCPYEECNVVCTRESSLQDHLNTHTGAKPYKCTESGCKFECGSASHLVHHRQRKHGHLKTRVSSVKGIATLETASGSLAKSGERSHRGRSLPPALPSRSHPGMPETITDSKRGMSTPPYASQSSGLTPLYDTPSPPSSTNWEGSSLLLSTQEQSNSPSPGPYYMASPSLPSSAVSTPRSEELASPSLMPLSNMSTPPHEAGLHIQEQSSYINDMLETEPDVFFASQPLDWHLEGGC